MNDPSAHQRDKHFLIALQFMWLLSAIGAFFGYTVTKNILQQEKLELFQQQTDQIQRTVEERMFAHIINLKAMQGIWASSNSGVTLEEFDNYLSFTNFIYQYPGVSSVVYADYIPKENPADLGAVIVKYIHPLEGREAGLGVDSSLRQERQASLIAARDTGEIISTPKTILATTYQPGFFLIAPIYNSSEIFIPESLAEKRSSLQGFVTLVFRDTQIFKAIFGESSPFPDLNFSIYHGDKVDHDHLLYNSDTGTDTPDWDDIYSPFQAKRSLLIGQNPWALVVTAKPTFGLTHAEETLPRIALIVSTVLLTIFAAVIWHFYRQHLKQWHA